MSLFANGVEGIFVKLGARKYLEKFPCIGTKGALNILVSSAFGFDITITGGCQKPIPHHILHAGAVGKGLMLGNGGTPGEFGVNSIGKAVDGLVHARLKWRCREIHPLIFDDKAEVMRGLPVDNAARLGIDIAMLENDVRDALRIIFQNVSNAKQAGEMAKVKP
ncbi:MAG: hypothetical protein U0984_03120, partial [Prosthecobacter sp.]|nr:hypothetical protein [Prosthecobacter sp.]